MANVLKHLPLPRTLFCIELSGRRVLVTGDKFIKVLSLDTYEEIQDIPSDSYNWSSLVISDKNMIFVSSSSGLYQYSLTDLGLVKVHGPSSDGCCLLYLKSKNTVLFNDRSNLLSLSLDNSTVTKLEASHNNNNIFTIVATRGEEFIFTTGGDNTLKQWDTASWGLIKSVDLESYGMSLVVKEKTGTVLVGMGDGSLAEYTLRRFSFVRREKVHKEQIAKIIQMSSGYVATCSDDGNVCFGFRENLLVKVSNQEIYSITELSDKSIACCGEDGLKVISSPIKDPQLFARINSISSSLDSIRNSSSDQKTQLISLLQHHLAQLLTPVQHQPDKFTGLALTLLPDLKSIQRSYCFEGQPEGRRRVLTQNYSLEMMSSNSTISEPQAILSLFDRKLRLFGKITNIEDPSLDFKVEQMKRGKWVFSMHDKNVTYQTSISGPARVNFFNGYLDCYTTEGQLMDRSGFQTTLKVDGVIKEVSSVSTDGVAVTSDRKSYRLNLETNTIEDLLKH